MLKIAKDLTLPIDFVTERVAFLARTGAGKSGGMRVMAEQMLDSGQFVICIDLRAGDMWGIRASGVGKGYPVLVVGGEHADLPLEPTAGKFVAEFLARDRISTVLDLSDFSKADANRFMTAFAHSFYKLNRDVVHLFIDEIDVVAGEKNFDPHCLEAIQYLQTKGRKRGIGITISTQRTALTNKTVIGQAGTLIAMQQIAPRDKNSVKEYLEGVADVSTVKEILGSLPTMKTREAYVYSPQFLGIEPQRITFDSFKTFDSMRTPRPGETRLKPKKLADINLTSIKKEMAATIEQSKANDPAELKKKVAELERQLSSAGKAPTKAASAQDIAAAVASRDQYWSSREEQIRAETSRLESDNQALVQRLTDIAKAATLNGQTPKPAKLPPPAKPAAHRGTQTKVPPVYTSQPVRPATATVRTKSGKATLSGKILQALATSRQPLERKRIASLCGTRMTHGSFKTRMNELIRGGLVGEQSGSCVVTQAGRDAAGSPEALPTGYALVDWWLAKFTEGSLIHRCLLHLRVTYPSWTARSHLATAVDTQPTHGSFKTRLNELTRKGVLESDKRLGIRINPSIFED